MLENVKKGWPVLAIGIVVGSFYAGRWSKKPDIQYKEKETTVAQTTTQTTEKTQVNTNVNKKEDQHVHITKVTVKKKDGTSVTTTKYDSDTHKDQVKVETKYVDKIVYKDKIVTKEVEKWKTLTYPQPNWQLGVKLGIDVSDFKPDTQLPYFQPFLVGAEVDRRIVGPVWLGVWGMTDTHLHSISTGIAIMAQF